MTSIPQKPLEDFLHACRRVGQYNLLLCRSGNLSCRLDDDHILITATRSWLADLQPHQVSLLRLSDGQQLNAASPSVETRFHLGILRQRKDVNVVLHFQSPAATTLACSRPETINFFVIPEVPFYIGPVAVIPYIDPGSADLADAVIPAMAAHNLAVLTSHGQVTVGKDYNDALQRAAFFELACDILLRGADRTQPLTPKAAADQIASGNTAGKI
jgi:ribulose-5-phosphate 4-epimerase/fuculose-1-phosphate aldolase